MQMRLIEAAIILPVCIMLAMVVGPYLHKQPVAAADGPKARTVGLTVGSAGVQEVETCLYDGEAAVLLHVEAQVSLERLRCINRCKVGTRESLICALLCARERMTGGRLCTLQQLVLHDLQLLAEEKRTCRPGWDKEGQDAGQ